MGRKRLKFIALVLIVPVLLSMTMVSALAAPKNNLPGKTIIIKNVEQLEDAIANQRDGQKWIIQKGDYDLTPNRTIVAGNQTGWYFPIVANNLTILGAGKPRIFSSYYSANSAWATQDLVCVFGDNCTLENLTFMQKMEVNKTVEVVGDVSFTIKGCSFIPNQENPGDGGCLYINGAGVDGEKAIRVIDNYFDYSLIALDGVSAGSVLISRNTFRHILDGVYAIGNVYWGSQDRMTTQYSNVYVNNNRFMDVASGQCVIKARLNESFYLNTKNRVNGKKVKPSTFQQYIVFGNTPGSHYQDCVNAKVYVGKTLFSLS